jgi:excisionase family DNA binding protein
MSGETGARRFLTIEQTAELLGMKEKTIYSLCARGQLPSVKIGHSIRIPLADLEAEIAEQIKEQAKRAAQKRAEIEERKKRAEEQQAAK